MQTTCNVELQVHKQQGSKELCFYQRRIQTLLSLSSLSKRTSSTALVNIGCLETCSQPQEKIKFYGMLYSMLLQRKTR